MKNFRFNFIINVWVKILDIEAHNYEEARTKLLGMTLGELLMEGWVEDYELSDIDFEELDDEEDCC